MDDAVNDRDDALRGDDLPVRCTPRPSQCFSPTALTLFCQKMSRFRHHRAQCLSLYNTDAAHHEVGVGDRLEQNNGSVLAVKTHRLF